MTATAEVLEHSGRQKTRSDNCKPPKAASPVDRARQAYGLQVAVAMADTFALVWIVEGEWCADHMHKLGMVPALRAPAN